MHPAGAAAASFTESATPSREAHAGLHTAGAAPALRLEEPSRRDVALAACYVFLLGLATRVTFVIYDGGFGYEPKADSLDFHLIALSLRDGSGFSRLGPDLSWQPTAYRMPLTPLFLAGTYEVLGVRPFAARILLACLGAAACATLVFSCGTAFGRKSGYKAGFVAGILAAVDPFLVMNQTLILLEPLHVLGVALSVWAALSYRKSPSRARLALVAAAGGLLTANRPDGFAYALLLAVAVSAPPDPERALTDERYAGALGTLSSRLKNAGVVSGAVLLVLVPWTVRNYRAVHAFVPLTTASGDLLLGANNQATYAYGPFLGYWAYGALVSGEAGSYGFAGEVRADKERRRIAFQYMTDHPLRLGFVIPVRILRGWDLYDPVGNARFGESWGRPRVLSLAALPLFYVGLALALLGASAHRKRWRDLAILYLMPAYLTLLFAATTGEPRYRAGAQLVVWMFAGSALAAIVDSRTRPENTEELQTRPGRGYAEAAALKYCSHSG